MKINKKRLVVKVGTSTITHDNGNTNLKALDRLSYVISEARNKGYEVVLVTSGAIAIGKSKLKLKDKTLKLREKQAAAATGQCQLMFLYDKFFHDYDQEIAQILLSAEDIENEKKKENLTNTFLTLLKMGVIPVVNENDSLSYAEIQSEDRIFGDNDMLSAVVSVLVGAGKLMILSDIDGFYDKDPKKNKDAQLISRIENINDETYAAAGGTGSRRGRGGMKTKLAAAKLATENGVDALVMNGNEPDNILRALEGEKIGTLFVAKE